MNKSRPVLLTLVSWWCIFAASASVGVLLGLQFFGESEAVSELLSRLFRLDVGPEGLFRQGLSGALMFFDGGPYLRLALALHAIFAAAFTLKGEKWARNLLAAVIGVSCLLVVSKGLVPAAMHAGFAVLLFSVMFSASSAEFLTAKRNFLTKVIRLFSKNRKVALSGIAVVAMGGGVLLEGAGVDWFEHARGIVTDYHFTKRGELPIGEEVVMVGINASTFDQGLLSGLMAKGEHEALKMLHDKAQYPLNRAVYGHLVERLFSLGAKVVGIDVVFPSSKPDEDAYFVEMVKKYSGRVVLAETSLDVEGGKQFLPPNPELSEAAGENGVGWVTVIKNPVDKVVRSVRHQTSRGIELGQGGEPDLVSFSARLASAGNGVSIPSGTQHYLINYRGPAGRISRIGVHESDSKEAAIALEEVFVDSVVKSDPKFRGGEIFKDKIVIVGPFAEILHDEQATPFGTMPGPEIHANIVSSLVAGEYVRNAPRGMTYLLGGVFTLVALLVAIFTQRVIVRVGVSAVIFGAVFGASVMVFSKAGILLDLVPVIVPGGLHFLVTLILDLSAEQLERSHVKSVLDKYVSKNVANVVVEQVDDFDKALRGQTKPVTVLFSDIRGFTTMSESRSPETLVAQLNEYFGPMVDAVLKEDGTLQKFIGDAIMAVWGDTHSRGLESDAARAIRAALVMRDALKQLNEGWKDNPDRLQLSIGVGVNHGRVVVGELGHQQRMEFTVLGDGVNLAARLESSTKQYGCDILVGQTAYELTRNDFVFRRVDNAKFKGKTAPIEVFTPLGLAGAVVPEWMQAYDRALDAFRAGRFEEAKGMFFEAEGASGGEDFLCEMYVKRCEKLIAEPPEGWDGSWTLTEK